MMQEKNIPTGIYEQIEDAEKLSAMLREIAPEAERVFRD